ncbi:MAG TPA: T9SS type A sorting domain-containing protein [Sunxiuqinia sp.]|nr:T9SS type A sorting domain-containing protein [Sunxiuqinia sp.]
MKQFILSISLLVCLLWAHPSFAQKASLSEKENYRIEKIYPNPVSDQVSLEIHAADYSQVKFELIDILGNKIKQWHKMELVPGDQKIKLDLQTYNPGFYLIKARIGEQVIVKRIRKV